MRLSTQVFAAYSYHRGMRATIFMRRCLEPAEIATLAGDTAVGARIVCGDEVVGEGVERTRATLDPSAHAEMEAIRQALLSRFEVRRLPEASQIARRLHGPPIRREQMKNNRDAPRSGRGRLGETKELRAPLALYLWRSAIGHTTRHTKRNLPIRVEVQRIRPAFIQAVSSPESLRRSHQISN
jgi:hypothetical protein